MKPTEWNKLVEEESRVTVSGAVVDAARAYLATVDGQIGTTDLVNALYPPQFAKDDGAMKTRKTLFQVVQRMAEGALSDCSSRGPEKRVMGRPGRAWLWHASRGPVETADELVARLLVSLGKLMAEGQLQACEGDDKTWAEFAEIHAAVVDKFRGVGVRHG